MFQSGPNHLVIVPKEGKLVETITAYATEHKLKGGLISGLGALKRVELGYYHLEAKTYHRKTFDEMDYELISLTGNIALKDGKPFVHVHAALGDDKFQVFGGHLFEALVAVTAEVTVYPHGFMPVREFDNALGLATIQRCEK